MGIEREPWEPTLADVYYSEERQLYALVVGDEEAMHYAWDEVGERMRCEYYEQLEAGWNELQREREHDRLWELRTMPLADYYLIAEWDEKRRAALKRADYRCQLCGRAEPLDVHHNNYSRRGNERDSDLTALCRPDHDLFHGREEVVP